MSSELIAACNPEVLAKDKSPSFIIFCFVSKSAWVIVEPVAEIVFPEIVMFVPAIKVFCFLFKAVSTYNFEVTCEDKVGVVFSTNT